LHIEIKYTHFLLSFVESSISLKRKTVPGEHDNGALPRNKRAKSNGFVSMRDHAKLATQLAAADEQNQLYQTTWMRMCESFLIIKLLIKKKSNSALRINFYFIKFY
jgi:hypothetical protein